MSDSKVKAAAKAQQPEMKFVTAQDIDAATAIVIEPHEIPEFGGYVRIRALDNEMLTELSKLVSLAEKRKKTFDVLTWLAAQFMVDEHGKPLFSPGQLKSRKRNVKGLRRVVAIGQHMSGMTAEAQEEIKEALKSDPLKDSDAELPSELECLLI